MDKSNTHPKTSIDIMLYQMVYTYVQWYEREKYRKLLVKTPPFKKFLLLTDSFDNQFLSVAQKSTINIHFGACVKHYLAFNRLAHIWKYKRAKMVVERDFFWNDLDTSKSHVYVLYQNGARFTFAIGELMRVMHNSICEHWEDDFSVTPQKPYNPYNKVVFARHELYNLYFYMRFQTALVIPFFFHLWFLENFDFQLFQSKHSRVLRKMCIKHFLNTSSGKELFVYQDILEMICENEYTRNWKIHVEFPKEKLLGCMRPYLYLYYLLNYDLLDYDEILYVSADLSDKLMDCYNLNPDFGRLVITATQDINQPFSPSTFSFKDAPLDTVFGNTDSSSTSTSSSVTRRSRMRQNRRTGMEHRRRRTRQPSSRLPHPLTSTSQNRHRIAVSEDGDDEVNDIIIDSTLTRTFNADFLPIHTRIY